MLKKRTTDFSKATLQGHNIQLCFFPCGLLTLTALFFVPFCTILISRCLSSVLRNRELSVDITLEPVKIE